jgi:hypothetical protein
MVSISSLKQEQHERSTRHRQHILARQRAAGGPDDQGHCRKGAAKGLL